MAKKYDWQVSLTIFVVALILAGMGLASVFKHATYLAWPTIIITDGYLFLVLLFAAIRADLKARAKKNCVCLKRLFPSRTAGVFVVIFLFTALISGFAGLYLGAHLSQCVTGPLDAVYFSFVTITTVGFGDYVPIGEAAKCLVMGELISGVILLLGIFPLLITRLSDF